MSKLNTPATDRIHSEDAHETVVSYSIHDDHSFSNIKLEAKTKIIEAEFTGCEFTSCKFSEVSFFDCHFEDCIFDNCNMGSISVKHTSFQNVMFKDTKLTGIQWAEASNPLDVNFNRCLMNYSSFIGVNLRNTHLLDCELKDTDFAEANLSKSNCRLSDFSGARFVNTNLVQADFTDARNYSIHPDGNILGKTKFSLPEALSLLAVYDIILT